MAALGDRAADDLVAAADRYERFEREGEPLGHAIGWTFEPQRHDRTYRADGGHLRPDFVRIGRPHPVRVPEQEIRRQGSEAAEGLRRADAERIAQSVRRNDDVWGRFPDIEKYLAHPIVPSWPFAIPESVCSPDRAACRRANPRSRPRKPAYRPALRVRC